jgi:hypothetical protein
MLYTQLQVMDMAGGDSMPCVKLMPLLTNAVDVATHWQ